MLFTKPNFETIPMEQAEQELAADSSIQLIDVRSAEEYQQGHIPNSLNIPLNHAPNISQLVADQSTPLFVYCLSGARSRVACRFFAKQGYTHVTNIGGIHGWTGETQQG